MESYERPVSFQRERRKGTVSLCGIYSRKTQEASLVSGVQICGDLDITIVGEYLLVAKGTDGRECFIDGCWYENRAG